MDSSVWINHLRDAETDAVLKLRAVSGIEVIVGDLVLLEVLQGARDELHAGRLERQLRRFGIEPMIDPDIAVSTARNFRLLRVHGITIRKTIDLVIGTFCIERGHHLLHDDRDFEPMVAHLGLRVA